MNQLVHWEPVFPSTITAMETFTFPTFPSYASPVHVALFNDVTNSAALRKKLIGASQMSGPEGDQARAEVDFGFIDASIVCHVYHSFKCGLR